MQIRPPKVKALLESLANNGDRSVHIAPSDRPSLHACWTITISHPVHAHYGAQCLYNRDVEHADLHMFEWRFDPRAGEIMFIVGPSQFQFRKE